MARALICLCLVCSLSACFHHGSARHIYTTPSHHASAAAYTPRSYYTVKKGDTLTKVGELFGIPYQDLARRNHLHRPYTIYVGQRIYLASSKHRTSTTKPQKKSHAKHVQKKTHPIKKKHIARTTVHLRWPVQGVLTSPFGRRGSRMHDGIDIGAKDGTPVHAAAAGTVVYSDSRLSGYGRLIIIRHTKDLFTAYAHNQKLLVKKGMHVQAGQVISRVGHSGHATGPHLHFEVRLGTHPVDPLRYLPHRK